MIKCRTFFTDKIWIPDIFCLLETLPHIFMSMLLWSFAWPPLPSLWLNMIIWLPPLPLQLTMWYLNGHLDLQMLGQGWKTEHKCSFKLAFIAKLIYTFSIFYWCNLRFKWLMLGLHVKNFVTFYMWLTCFVPFKIYLH